MAAGRGPVMIMPLSVRVDNRLLHGQIVQFWLPHLGIDHLIIADDEVSKDDPLKVLYRRALPAAVMLSVVSVDDLAGLMAAAKAASLRVMLLVGSIDSARRIVDSGLAVDRLVIGNVHASPERARVTDAVYLSNRETACLAELRAAGVSIEIQTYPGDSLRFKECEGGRPIWER